MIGTWLFGTSRSRREDVEIGLWFVEVLVDGTETFSIVQTVSDTVRIEFRPRHAAVLLFVVLLGILLTSVVVGSVGDGSDRDPAVDKIEMRDGSELWPYTSRDSAFEERTLAINLVVYGDPVVVETLLRESPTGDWEELESDEMDIAPAEDTEYDLNGTRVWGAADGAIRYTYVDHHGDELWLTESYQLSDGEYLGTRHHVRAYTAPGGGEWTAMQAHLEHWDWFLLRHSVHSVEESQQYVETEFLDRWYVDDLRRDRFGNEDRIDSDGWVTIVELDDRLEAILLGLLLFGSITVRKYRDVISNLRYDPNVRTGARAFLLVAALVGFYVAIRLGAVGVEGLFPDVNTKYVVATVYPLLVVGFPVLAYRLSRQFERSTHAFTAASVGFILAIFVDYTYLGVVTLPLSTFVHRVALAAAIGFIAAGASRQARDPTADHGYVRIGTLLWFVAVVLPLLHFL